MSDHAATTENKSFSLKFFSGNSPALFALTLLFIFVYAQARNFGLISFDDPTYILNSKILSKGLSLEGVKLAFTTIELSNWHPLTWISYMIDKYLWGTWYGGFHLTNILFHYFNTLLLFFWLIKLSGRPLPSLAVAAFFAIHPQRAESVIWIAERKDVLCVFFGLLSLYAYTTYTATKVKKYYIFSLISFGLSLMSKSMLVTLPCLFLLLDAFALNRWSENNKLSPQLILKTITEKIPFFSLSLLLSAITILAQKKGGAMDHLNDYSLMVRLASATISYSNYLIKLFLPVNLSIIYPHPGENVSFLHASFALLSLVLLTALIFRSSKQFLWLKLGWLWFFGTLVPVIGIIQVGAQSMADRYSYFPTIGILCGLFFSLDLLTKESKQRKIFVITLTLFIFTINTFTTYKEVSIWKKSSNVFAQACKNSGYHHIAWRLLAADLVAEGNYVNALPVLEQYLKTYPSDIELTCILGKAYYSTGQKDKGLSTLENTMSRYPMDLVTKILWFNLNWEYRGLTPKAEEVLQKMREISPNHPIVNGASAKVNIEKGNYRAAFSNLEQQIKIQSNDPSVLQLYSLIAVRLGLWDAAHSAAEKLREINPNNGNILYVQALIAYQKGQYRQASDFIKPLLKLDPANQTMLEILFDISPSLGEEPFVQNYLTLLSLKANSPAVERLQADWALKYKDYPKAQKIIRKLIFQDKSDSPQNKFIQAKLSFSEENFDLCIALLNELVSLDPKNELKWAELLSKAYRMRAKSGDPESALKWIQVAEKLAPFQDVFLLSEKSLVYSSLGRHAEAQAAANSAWACYKQGDQVAKERLAQIGLKPATP